MPWIDIFKHLHMYLIIFKYHRHIVQIHMMIDDIVVLMKNLDYLHSFDRMICQHLDMLVLPQFVHNLVYVYWKKKWMFNCCLHTTYLFLLYFSPKTSKNYSLQPYEKSKFWRKTRFNSWICCANIKPYQKHNNNACNCIIPIHQ